MFNTLVNTPEKSTPTLKKPEKTPKKLEKKEKHGESSSHSQSWEADGSKDATCHPCSPHPIQISQNGKRSSLIQFPKELLPSVIPKRPKRTKKPLKRGWPGRGQTGGPASLGPQEGTLGGSPQWPRWLRKRRNGRKGRRKRKRLRRRKPGSGSLGERT